MRVKYFRNVCRLKWNLPCFFQCCKKTIKQSTFHQQQQAINKIWNIKVFGLLSLSASIPDRTFLHQITFHFSLSEKVVSLGFLPMRTTDLLEDHSCRFEVFFLASTATLVIVKDSTHWLVGFQHVHGKSDQSSWSQHTHLTLQNTQLSIDVTSPGLYLWVCLGVCDTRIN